MNDDVRKALLQAEATLARGRDSTADERGEAIRMIEQALEPPSLTLGEAREVLAELYYEIGNRGRETTPDGRMFKRMYEAMKWLLTEYLNVERDW